MALVRGEHVGPNTLDNARNGVQEPGIARFDFFQNADDLTRFILNEVYLTPEAPAAHKASAHYLRWRDEVVDMMAEPRSNVPLVNLFPADKDF
jgi:quinol monooxygenase YgiN